MIRKLTSQNGESIAEVLVATLVVALGSVLFAGMVNAAQVMSRNSDSAYKELIETQNIAENYDKSSNDSVTVSDSTPISIKKADGDNSLKLSSGAKESIILYQIYDPKSDKDQNQDDQNKTYRYFIYAPERNSR